MTIEARYGAHAATLTKLTGNMLTFEGASALAPGAPVTLTGARADGTPFSIEGRTLGSHKPSAESPRFEIRVRLVNLTKPDRAWLVALFGG